MVKATELAVLQVNGQLFQDWESVTVRQCKKEHPYYFFRFTCSEGMPLASNWAKMQIKPGDQCQVTLAGQPAVQGLVSTRQVFYDSKRHHIEIQGASNVLGLAYTSAISKTMEHKDVTFEQFARALLKPCMPKINFVVKGQLPQIKFPRISIPHGTSILEALEIPLRNLGNVSLTSNVKGDLVAVAGPPTSGGDTVVEGKNILEGREIIFNPGMATGTYQLSQGTGGDDKSGAAVSHQPYFVKQFTGLGNQYLPGVIPNDMMSSEKEHLQGRGQMEHDMMNEDRVTVFITVHGWLKPSGGLWECDQPVSVVSPMLIMNGSEKLTTKSVTFSQDNERGSRTVLELCNELAMLGNVPQ
jgi:prophage tail gpP-like protein